MTSTKALREKALRTLRGQVHGLPSMAEGIEGADDQARYAREYQGGVDAVLRMLDNQIKQALEHPEEPEPVKPDPVVEVRRLRGVLRQIAELLPASQGECAALAAVALRDQPRPTVRLAPSGPTPERKFTPRRAENIGRSNRSR